MKIEKLGRNVISVKGPLSAGRATLEPAAIKSAAGVLPVPRLLAAVAGIGPGRVDPAEPAGDWP